MFLLEGARQATEVIQSCSRPEGGAVSLARGPFCLLQGEKHPMGQVDVYRCEKGNHRCQRVDRWAMTSACDTIGWMTPGLHELQEPKALIFSFSVVSYSPA